MEIKPKYPFKYLIYSGAAGLCLIPLALLIFEAIDQNFSSSLLIVQLFFLAGAILLSILITISWLKKKAIFKEGVLKFEGTKSSSGEDFVFVDMKNVFEIEQEVRRTHWQQGVPIRVNMWNVDEYYLIFKYKDETSIDVPLDRWDKDSIENLLSEIRTLYPSVKIIDS